MLIRLAIIDASTDKVLDDSYTVDASWATAPKKTEELGQDLRRTIGHALRHESLSVACANCRAPEGTNCYPDWGCTPENRILLARRMTEHTES